MMDVFAVTIKAEFYLMAESEIEAEELAQTMMENAEDEMPTKVNLDYQAYLTPNQSDKIKGLALNLTPNKY